MRQHLAAGALALAAAAHADPPKPIDMTGAGATVQVLRDDTGKLYVVPTAAKSGDEARALTFYGDGKTMYQQRVVMFSTTSGDAVITMWAPRVRNLRSGTLEVKAGAANLICEMQQRKYVRKPLALVGDDEAKHLLASATFLPPLWERRIWFFGRAGSTYYLVDVRRDENGGGGHRLFVGPKGRLRPVAITDVANDAAGRLITTKAGVLDIKPDAAALWKAGKKTVEVARLQPEENSYLIYRELGVYGQLGTICEDQ